MQMLEKTDIQLGYIPLLDSVAILWAHHQGYFTEVGLQVTLVKETSWASLRDRLAFGVLDIAHCLSAMLPAAAIGEDQIGIPLQTPLVLSTNRAFISLSQKLCYSLNISQNDSALESAEKVTSYLNQAHNIQLAHVFKQSIHHYCLRNWLALADQNIAQSIRLVTLPPPFMVEAIAHKTIDGFCVGEPWNIQAEIEGHSQVIARSQDIIPNIADKVLATTQEWAQQYPRTLAALKQAVQRAQTDLACLSDLSPVWKLLEQFNIIRFHCAEDTFVQQYHQIQSILRSFGPQDMPRFEDFEWILLQMKHWDHLQLSSQQMKKIAQSCIANL